MNRSYRPAVKRLAPATAVVVAVGLSAAGLASGSFAAETSTPALELTSPISTQKVERYAGEPVYLYDLGVYAVAGKTPFEVHTQRGASYLDPIKTTVSLGGKTIQVPAELSTNVNELDKFFAYSVTNKAGTVVKQAVADFCPNAYEAARAVKDGAATSPYPEDCGSHPFAKGGVMGVQNGWSVPALGGYRGAPVFKGADGVYTVRVVVRAPWRKALGLKAADTDISVKVNVKTVTEGSGKESGAASTLSTSAHSHGASTQVASGALSPQRAKIEAVRVKALGTKNKPHAAPPVSTMKAAEVADSGPKPDLQSLPAYQIELSRTDGNGKPSKNTYLNFGATVWNAGPSPLVVDGFRIKDTKNMKAYQYFYDKDGNEVGSAPAGGLEWDPRPGHTHWHFKAFATYRLLDSTKKFTKRSGKEAFCLLPTDPVNLNKPGSNWKPSSTDLTTACGDEGANSIREVLDVGWGDTYGQYLPGQSFNVTNLANGVYFIEVLANPDAKLVESNHNNNSALRKVRLGGKVGGKRTLKVYDYAGIKAP